MDSAMAQPVDSNGWVLGRIRYVAQIRRSRIEARSPQSMWTPTPSYVSHRAPQPLGSTV